MCFVLNRAKNPGRQGEGGGGEGAESGPRLFSETLDETTRVNTRIAVISGDVAAAFS